MTYLPEDPDTNKDSQATPNSAGNAQGFLADNPAGDVALDDLFPNLDGNIVPTTVDEAGQPEVASLEPAPQAGPEQFFVEGVQSKYKTREATIQGINQKDEIIRSLREKAIRGELQSGIDPLTGQRFEQQATQTTQESEGDQNWFFDSLGRAIETNDKSAYEDTYRRLIREEMQEVLAPLAPMVTGMAKQHALASSKQQVKDIDKFVGSQEYSTVLEGYPRLKQAIEFSEQDPRFHNDLSELYQITYHIAQGQRLPEAVRPQEVGRSAALQRPVPRPTTAPTALTPPQGSPSAPGLDNTEGRKRIIEQAESVGLDKLVW